MKIIIAILLMVLALLSYGLGLDPVLGQWVAENRISFITPIMHFLSFIGSAKFLVFINILILIYMVRKQKLLGVKIPLGTLLGWSLTAVLKVIVKRNRPNYLPLAVETSYSFPSGHATAMTAFLMMISSELKGDLQKKMNTVFPLLIFFVSFSRIYLGVHFLSDVLFGSGLSLLFSVFYLKIWNILKKQYS